MFKSELSCIYQHPNHHNSMRPASCHSGPIKSFLPEPQSLAYTYCGIGWFLAMSEDVRTDFSRSFAKLEVAKTLCLLTFVDERHLEFLCHCYTGILGYRIYSGSQNLVMITAPWCGIWGRWLLSRWPEGMASCQLLAHLHSQRCKGWRLPQEHCAYVFTAMRSLWIALTNMPERHFKL